MRQSSSPAAVDATWHPQERRAFLYLPLLALLVTIVVELFNHKTFTEGPASFGRFLTDEPLAFLVDALIVLVTLSPAFFFRRQGAQKAGAAHWLRPPLLLHTGYSFASHRP